MADHRSPNTSPIARRVVGLALTGLALTGVGAGLANAEPSAPTNGGNGAGSSGQCTGPAAERPTACVSPGGVSQQ